MKNLIILLLTLFISNQSIAQFGSQESEVKNLAHLAKVWGFLKYHHPDLKDCALDWDQELIKTLKELNGAPQSEYHNIVHSMLDRLSDIQNAPGELPSTIQDEQLNNLNVDWMQSSHFSAPLRTRLQNIYQKTRRGGHCLLDAYFTDGNLNFEYENGYAFLGTSVDIYYRLLAAFRYWNIIEYFFPYKHIMDQDWNMTLEQFVLPIAYAEDELAYHLAMKEFTTYINDSHGFFGSTPYYNWLGSGLTPYKTKYIEDQTVITEVAEDVSSILSVGDIILEVEGVHIDSLRKHCKKYTAGSNEVVINRNIDRSCMIRGPLGSFEITVEKSDGSIKTVNSISRDFTKYQDFQFGNEDKPSWTTIDVNGCTEFGYVDMGYLQVLEIPRMVNELWDKEAIIFDIRNYPNGTLWELIPQLFNHRVPIATFATPNKFYAGQFYWADEVLGYNNSNNVYKGRLIILFNEETQSQAEYTVMGLENHPNAIKIGSQTSAADGNVSYFALPGGITTYFTGLGTYYPDKTPTQRIGIIPDIEVKPTLEGIRNGKDEVLDTALDCALLGYTSTENQTQESKLKFYPNPIRNELQVESNYKEAVHLMIYNAQGKLVTQSEINRFKNWNLKDLEAGLYYAVWNKNGNIFTQKLIKID